MIKKVNEKWWIYIDYTDPNKAYSKHSFSLLKTDLSLLKTDQLVDATFGYKLLNFMDYFSAYNQIKMALENEENIALIIEKGI